MNLSRGFAKQHDEALFSAVAATLELGQLTDRDRLLMQRKVSNHGLGLRSMEKNLEFLFLAGFMRSITSIKHTFPNFNSTLQYTIQGDSGLVAIVDDITIMGTLEALSLVEQSRALLQTPSNYLVNTDKQYVYTMNEEHVSEIQRTLPDHTIIYIGGDRDFCLSEG